MIKGIATRNGVPLIVAGLSAENVQRMKDGKPILFSMEVDGKAIEVLLLYGATEEDIARDLLTVGIRMPTVPIETEEGHKKYVHG